MHRIVRHIRALVVLPTRDLAIQVKEVFDHFSHNCDADVRIGILIGQSSFSDEQVAKTRYNITLNIVC